MKEKSNIEATNPPLHKADVSGSISVSMVERHNQRQISSKSKFFIPHNDYKVSDDGECLTISNVGIDYNGRTYKAIKLKSGWIRLNILSEMPIGNFDFDKYESNCDEVRIYYR